MDSRYWIIFEWAGAPMPSNPDHKGWTEIESVSFDSPESVFNQRHKALRRLSRYGSLSKNALYGSDG